MIKAVVTFILTILVHTAFTQSFYKAYSLPAENNNISQFTCLVQLFNGYLLAGSTAGLYSFDGLGFHKIKNQDERSSQSISAIAETNKGIWVGFADGRLGWLKNNSIILQNPEEGHPKKTIKKIVQTPDGIIWIATAGEGIYYFDQNRFYNINTDDGLSDNYVYDIIPWEKGIAAGTDKGINFCVLQNGKKQVTAITSSTGKIPDNIVRCLSYTNHSMVYGTQDAGIGNFSSIAWQYTSNWQESTVNAVLQDGNTIWAGTDYALISGNIVNGFTRVLNGKISCLLKDREGNIWAGSVNQLIKTNGSTLLPLKQITANENASLHALLIDKNNHLWYNVAQGLKHLSQKSNGTWTEKIYSLPVSINSQITTLYEDRFDNIWIGTMGNGVFLLDNKTGNYRKITENPALSKASVLSITGKKNHVWVASLEGAVKCTLTDQNVNINAPIAIDEFNDISGIGTNYIYSVFIDSKDRTWFATDGKGIAMYDGVQIRNYDRRNGLKSEVVYQVREDAKGNIWFSTYNAGVVKFDGKTFRHFGMAEGLTDINITSLEADSKGNMYLGHKNGIDILNTTTYTFSYIDDQQGIGTLNADLNSLMPDAAGNIFFVADNTIYQYQPVTADLRPGIVIDNIQLFLNDVAINNGHVFDADEDNISFYYTGLSYSQSSKIRYQYKLEGYGEEWITTNDRRRDFPQLPPGTYTFRVRASLNGNFENAQEAAFTFTIRKPLWMRWWFITLAVLLVAGGLYWFIKDRERRLQKWERLEKDKIRSQFETLRNQVNPHFLFNSFNTLVSEIEEDPKRAVEYVEHMADFFRSIVTYREKDVISLREELSIIKDYLFIQEKRYGNAFQVNINTSDEEKDGYFLAPLTLQLLAENAIKHNAVLKEKPLLLEIFIEAGQLIVRNNINPKLQSEKSAGLGLQNIQKRYALLTGKAVIISNDNDYFTVIIPLIKKSDATSTDHRR